eukprot:1432628-Alexandrium_andersonii.AAC.1
MSASLVGSEMCIRDRPLWQLGALPGGLRQGREAAERAQVRPLLAELRPCLLYTSDAADDM